MLPNAQLFGQVNLDYGFCPQCVPVFSHSVSGEIAGQSATVLPGAAAPTDTNAELDGTGFTATG